MREPLPAPPLPRRMVDFPASPAPSAASDSRAGPGIPATDVRYDLRHYAIAATGFVQRVELTDEQMAQAFVQYSGNLGDRRNHRVLEAWDDTWGEPNCHGYSLTHEKTQATGTELLTAVLQGHGRVIGREIAVFLDRNYNLAHSGWLLGNGLRHLFKKVGVLHSRATRDHLFGYAQRINTLDGLEIIQEIVSGRRDEALRLIWVEAAERRLQRAANEHDAQQDPRVHELYDEIDDVRASLKEQSLVDLHQRLEAAQDMVVKVNWLVKSLADARAGGSAASAGQPAIDANANPDAHEEKR